MSFLANGEDDRQNHGWQNEQGNHCRNKSATASSALLFCVPSFCLPSVPPCLCVRLSGVSRIEKKDQGMAHTEAPRHRGGKHDACYLHLAKTHNQTSVPPCLCVRFSGFSRIFRGGFGEIEVVDFVDLTTDGNVEPNAKCDDGEQDSSPNPDQGNPTTLSDFWLLGRLIRVFAHSRLRRLYLANPCLPRFPCPIPLLPFVPPHLGVSQPVAAARGEKRIKIKSRR